MTEFCTCGSIKIGGNCTNKNCINRSTAKPAAKSATKRASSAVKRDTTKTAKPRKASKVITYNLYETKSEESI